MDAFCILKNSLVSKPVMAFPHADRQYALITDAATGTDDTAGGLGVILTQKDKFDNFYAISYASCQLKDHNKNIHHSFLNPLLLCGEWILLMST
jgi:RNase H-like domain found in reverse transcriptase